MCTVFLLFWRRCRGLVDNLDAHYSKIVRTEILTVAASNFSNAPILSYEFLIYWSSRQRRKNERTTVY